MASWCHSAFHRPPKLTPSQASEKQGLVKWNPSTDLDIFISCK